MPTTYNPKYNTYIGARYVPLVDGQWDNSKQYEPLTIVLYQGNSYTSKTYVPVGVDILNETYWVLTGDYNAQVESIQQQVNQNTRDIAELKTDVTDLPEQVQANTQAISSLNEKVGDASIGRYAGRYDIYVSQTGSDDNDGSQNSPFRTAEKAFENLNSLSVNGSVLFVNFQDDGVYSVSQNVICATSLHIVGNGNTRLNFDSSSNIRFYASHINISSITIGAPNSSSFAFDGSSFLTNNVVFDIPIVEVIFSNGWFISTTLNCVDIDTSKVQFQKVTFNGNGSTKRINGLRSDIDLRSISGWGTDTGTNMTFLYLREVKLWFPQNMPSEQSTKYANFINAQYCAIWSNTARLTGAGAIATNIVASDSLNLYVTETSIVNKYPT